MRTVFTIATTSREVQARRRFCVQGRYRARVVSQNGLTQRPIPPFRSPDGVYNENDIRGLGRPGWTVAVGGRVPLLCPAGRSPSPSKDRNVHIIDAIVLAKLLSTPPARRVLLHTNRYRSEEGDQRNEIDLRELAGRVRTPPDGLVGEVAQARHEAERLLKLGAERGYEALAFDHAAYPAVLATIADPPPVLWLHGDRAVFTRTSVAIVGSRAGSSYACEVAQRLGTELSDRGVTVVSGLARGVDGVAHRGALLGPGGTIAVLGSGLDVIYPPEHVALARSIVSDGAVVTEYPPGMPPLAFHFPRRNRIISGLVRAVVVVEASQRSGSLITARCGGGSGAGGHGGARERPDRQEPRWTCADQGWSKDCGDC